MFSSSHNASHYSGRELLLYTAGWNGYVDAAANDGDPMGNGDGRRGPGRDYVQAALADPTLPGGAMV